MPDRRRLGPDRACLFDVATEQHGYFTAAQAHECGFTWRSLHYHTRRGRFRHLRRGLYRLRDFLPSPQEEVVAAWLAAGRDQAVVSHPTALDLLDQADVIPDAVHLTVPRSRRGLAVPYGVAIHTSTRPFAPEDVVAIAGLPVTAAARTIADVAAADLAPVQLERAVATALGRGLAKAAEQIDQALRRVQRREAVATR